jgi:tetratricopeptide (TPR) repeat protein
MARINYKQNAAEKAVILLFLLFIAARVLNILTAAHIPYIQYRAGDELYYHNWGLAISQGQSTIGVFFVSPFFAYLLGLFYSVFGASINAVLVMNGMLGVASLYLIYLTSKRIAGQSAAIITLILAGFCVAPPYYELFTEKTTTVLFLTSLSFNLITLSIESEKKLHWALSGAAVGLGTLAHPLLLILIPAVWLSVILTKSFLWKKVVIFSATALLTILPATIHNYLSGNDLVLTCSSGGLNFYIGNHSGNSTGLYTSPSFSVASIKSEENNFRQEAERRAGKALLPSEVSAYWFKQGIAESTSNLELSLTRFARRLRWAIGNEELSDSRNIEFYREQLPLFKVPLVWGFGLVSFLGMAGATILVWAGEKKALFCLLFIGTYVLAIGFFFVFGRLRLPLLVPFSILAGAGIVKAYSQLKVIRLWSLILSLPLLLFLLWLSFGKVLADIPESYFTDYFNMGNKYLNEGKFDEATVEYENALWVRPGEHTGVQPVVLELADLYVKRGKLSAAQRLLQRAITNYPENKIYKDKLAALQLSR